MREAFVAALACPACGGGLELGAVRERRGDDVLAGELRCPRCPRAFPVENGIGIFVERSSYADSFGWQWSRFHRLQRDSYNGSHLVRDTILLRSGWTPDDLRGRSVLECGCGSGNDSEVLAALAGTLVSVDLSSAVHAMAPEVLARESVLVLQADLRDAPLRPGSFDVVYCHRVIQHTPDPETAFASIARHVRPGGILFLHSYDTHWKSILHFRYWLRPLIRPLPWTAVARGLRIVGPVLYPLVGLLNRIAFLRRPVKLLAPFENHDRILQKAGAKLTARERYDYAFLATFDALTPRHDHPSSPATVERWFADAGFVDVVIRSRNPVIATGRRPAPRIEAAREA